MCTIGVHHTGVAVQLWHLSLPTGITVDSLISILYVRFYFHRSQQKMLSNVAEHYRNNICILFFILFEFEWFYFAWFQLSIE